MEITLSYSKNSITHLLEPDSTQKSPRALTVPLGCRFWTLCSKAHWQSRNMAGKFVELGFVIGTPLSERSYSQRPKK